MKAFQLSVFILVCLTGFISSAFQKSIKRPKEYVVVQVHHYPTNTKDIYILNKDSVFYGISYSNKLDIDSLIFSGKFNTGDFKIVKDSVYSFKKKYYYDKRIQDGTSLSFFVLRDTLILKNVRLDNIYLKKADKIIKKVNSNIINQEFHLSYKKSNASLR